MDHKAKKTYTGFTDHLGQRLKQHKRGTKRSYELIHVEPYDSESLARTREKFFKTGKGRTVLRNILNNK